MNRSRAYWQFVCALHFLHVDILRVTERWLTRVWLSSSVLLARVLLAVGVAKPTVNELFRSALSVSRAAALASCRAGFRANRRAFRALERIERS